MFDIKFLSTFAQNQFWSQITAWKFYYIHIYVLSAIFFLNRLYNLNKKSKNPMFRHLGLKGSRLR